MSRMMLVPLSQGNVEALLALKRRPDDTLDAVVARVVQETQGARAHGEAEARPAPSGRGGQGPRYTIRLFNDEWSENSAKAVLLSVLGKLSKRQPSLLPRLSDERGRTRRLVARRREELYAPDRADLAADHAAPLGDGWWVSTNHACRDVRRWLERMSELAGLRYGLDLVVTPELG